MSAIRLARAATGREKLLKFAGTYHGHVDGLLAEAGSGLATAALPASPGVPAEVAASTIVVPWNDRDALLAATAEHDFAALLGFDEVITGFRVSAGGAQELTGVIPDITVLGKVIGGGLPAAAYGAADELMNRIAPAGDVYQAGTLSGNPLAVAAGRATLNLLDEDAYLHLAATTETLAHGLREAAGDRPVQVEWAPGLLTVFFREQPVRDYDGALACDTEAYGAWCRALLARGVYPPPSQFEAWFPSLAHSPEHITRTLEAAAAAFSEIAR